jgi:hypothetical protein
MNREQDIVEALKALAASDREVQAPPELEEKLVRAFRRNRAPRWPWAIAAAAVIASILIYEARPRTEVVVPRDTPAPQVSSAPPREEAAPAVPSVRRAVRRPAPAEIVTDFFPLMDVAPPIDRGRVVRVSLPAAAMQTVGLPVREDRLSERVQADVLMSEEGLATAIRFVKTSQ